METPPLITIMLPSLTHIINPVAADAVSRFYFIQQVTYQTMQVAQNFAIPAVDVSFCTVQFAEDRRMIPNRFNPVPNLVRSVQDVGTFRKKRKLPILKDILDSAYTHCHTDYFIYTNVDIGLMPQFYRAVAMYIQKGYDAFTINRRTIRYDYQNVAEIPLMYADLGEPHRGWDCFVFRRDIVPHFRLGTACIGAPLVGLVLIANLMAFSNNFRQFTREHLTFHLGDDRAWHGRAYADYAKHNKCQALKILRELDEYEDSFHPGSPPKRYLFFHQNLFLSHFYALLMRFNIPAKYTRRVK